MKILITGGAGFIGSAVIRHLIRNSTDSVVNVDKLSYAGNLEKGHIIAKTDLIMKRPGDGISPMEFEKCLGKSLRLNVQEDQMLKWEDLE